MGERENADVLKKIEEIAKGQVSMGQDIAIIKTQLFERQALCQRHDKDINGLKKDIKEANDHLDETNVIVSNLRGSIKTYLLVMAGGGVAGSILTWLAKGGGG